MSTDFEKDVSKREFNGPGERLRFLREAKKKAIEDVSDDLKLNKKLLIAIENDDYHDLYSDSLAKSYLRTYAKWAGYPETEILQEFEAKNFSSTIAPKKPQIIRNRDLSLPSNKTRWFTYVVLGGLIILVWLWWHNHSGNADKSIGSNILPQEPSRPLLHVPASTSSSQPLVQPLPIQKITDDAPLTKEQSPSITNKEPEPPPSKNLDD